MTCLLGRIDMERPDRNLDVIKELNAPLNLDLTTLGIIFMINHEPPPRLLTPIGILIKIALLLLSADPLLAGQAPLQPPLQSLRILVPVTGIIAVRNLRLPKVSANGGMPTSACVLAVLSQSIQGF